MSSASSPLHYNELEDAFITDAHFKVDISQKMKVPNKISFNPDANGIQPNWNDNINMQVPERILVVGQHQHIGTRAPPREIAFDNSLLPSEPFPCDPRVATPPRTLTLDKYPFPGLEDDAQDEKEIVAASPVAKQRQHFDDSELEISCRESSQVIGAGGEGLTTHEQVLHLRRQMAKLNRRLMALELENMNRIQKEKIFFGLGVAYMLLKAIMWLNRN